MNEFVSRLISRHEYTRECSTASCTCGGALVNKSRPAVSRRPWLYQMQPSYPSRVTTVVLDHRDSSCTVISLCWSRKRVKETREREREKIKEKKQSKTKTNMPSSARTSIFVFIPPGRQGLFSNIRRTLAKKPFYCGTTVGRLLNERRRK